jgi:hypothetical protein
VRRVGIDYEVMSKASFKAFPIASPALVEVRLTGRTVEVFAEGERIAVHVRSSGNVSAHIA